MRSMRFISFSALIFFLTGVLAMQALHAQKNYEDPTQKKKRPLLEKEEALAPAPVQPTPPAAATVSPTPATQEASAGLTPDQQKICECLKLKEIARGRYEEAHDLYNDQKIEYREYAKRKDDFERFDPYLKKFRKRKEIYVDPGCPYFKTPSFDSMPEYDKAYAQEYPKCPVGTSN